MDMRRADTIVDDLEQMIVTGVFSDGTRLDEVRLAEKFGVSRTPIREALQKLAASGLVEQLPRRGVFVREPGPAELVEMFEAMAELEASCGHLAALRITAASLANLRAANDRCRIAAEADDADRYYRENEQFHQIIYAAAENGYLQDQATRLQRRLKPFRRLQLHARGRIKQSMAEHEAILAALAAGESEVAARALRDHVTVQGERFHHLILHLKSRN
jgi:DNA-binding GntR family transcriptional regulator